MKKIFLIVMIFSVITIIFINNSIAADIVGDLGNLQNYASNGVESVELVKKINPIITILQTIGSITSVVVLIAIGMKYMFGSIEEKAEYKKTMFPYIIGCIIVFSVSNLVGFIFNIAKDLF